MSYEFPADLAERIHRQMALGNYASEDDVLRDALEALDARNEDLAAIRAGVADFEAGRLRPISQVADEIRRKYGWTSEQ